MALTRVAPAGIGSTPGTGYVIGDSFLHSRGLNATDGYYTGIVTTQNLRVIGDLEVEGTTTTLDTALTEVDKLEVGANNNTVGVAITQSGTGDILNLYDESTQVFTVKDGGRVGIGTDGPLAKLEVYTDSNDVGGIVQVIQDGTGDASIDFQLKGTREYTLGIDNSDGDKFKLSGSAGLGSNDLITVTSTGSVGIGSDNPQKKLDVAGDVKILDNSPRLEFHDANAADNTACTGGFEVYDASGNRGIFIGATESASNLHFGIRNDEKMRITYDGKVGIGSQSPAQTLDIMSANPVIRLTDTDPSGVYSQIDGAGGDLILAADGGAGSSNSFISLRVDGTDANAEKVRITSGGGVGIGVTDPDSKFHVNSGAETVPARFESTGAQSRIGFQASGTPSSYHVACGAEANNFIVYTNNAEKLRIDSSGNVGIGTDNPDGKLAVTGNGYNQINIANNNTANTNKLGGVTSQNYAGDKWSIIQTYSPSGSNQIYYGSADGSYRGATSHYFYVNSSPTATTGHTEALRITSSGNVGIGTNNVDHRLEVFGPPGIGDLSIKSAASAAAGTEHSKLRFRVRNASNQESTKASIHVESAANWGGNLIFGTKTSSGGLSESTVERLRITSGGRVAIGTDNPGSVLDIQREAAGSEQMLQIRSHATAAGDFDGDYSVEIRHATSTVTHGMLISNKETQDARRTLDIADGNGVFATFTNGKVGIGTDGPSAPLHVATAANASWVAIFGSMDATNSSTYQALAIKNDVAGYPALTNGSSTDVLDLRSAGSVQVTIDNNNNDTTKSFRVMANGEGGGGTELFRVNENGRIGVGVDAPQHLLHLKSTGDATLLIQADSDNSGENDNPRILLAQDGSTNGHLEIGLIGDVNTPLNNAPVNSCYIQANNHADQPLCIGHMGENVMTVKSDRVGIGTNNPTEALHVIGQNRGSAGTGSKWDIARFVAHNYVPANSGGLTIGAYWHNTDVNQRRAYIQSSQNTNSGSTVRDLLLNPDGGRIGIGRDDPSYLLDIRQYTNTTGSNGTTMMRLQNNVGSNSGSLGDIHSPNGQRTYIDFTFIDGNVNFTPQVRIGAQVGALSGDQGIEDEGSGSFVVFTSKGSGNAGSGTLSEKLRVTPNGNVRASNAFYGGGGNIMGMLPLGSSSGNTAIDTGISINASNGGGAMMVLASRNTGAGTATAAGIYLLDFRYDGNHVPQATFIGGDNFCLFNKNGSNNLTVNCQSGNWSVAGFFAGYGIGNQLNR